MADPYGVYKQANAVVEGYLNSPDSRDDLKVKVRQSLDIIAQALSEHSIHDIAMSYNGGKDCLVMLYLIFAQFYRMNIKDKLPTIYIRSPDSFPEVDSFVEHCSSKYHLDTEQYDQPMKKALSDYLDRHKHIKAIFVGIRHSDPWAETLKYIQKTDHDWPDFLRVHPVLDWEYDEIWEFLRAGHIEYCSLYDKGFTSLGGMKNTTPNPDLRINGTDEYQPAYLLKDFGHERVGRS